MRFLVQILDFVLVLEIFYFEEVIETGVDMVIDGYMTFMWLKHHNIVTSVATISNS